MRNWAAMKNSSGSDSIRSFVMMDDTDRLSAMDGYSTLKGNRRPPVDAERIADQVRQLHAGVEAVRPMALCYTLTPTVAISSKIQIESDPEEASPRVELLQTDSSILTRGMAYLHNESHRLKPPNAGA